MTRKRMDEWLRHVSQAPLAQEVDMKLEIENCVWVVQSDSGTVLGVFANSKAVVDSMTLSYSNVPAQQRPVLLKDERLYKRWSDGTKAEAFLISNLANHL